MEGTSHKRICWMYTVDDGAYVWKLQRDTRRHAKPLNCNFEKYLAQFCVDNWHKKSSGRLFGNRVKAKLQTDPVDPAFVRALPEADCSLRASPRMTQCCWCRLNPTYLRGRSGNCSLHEAHNSEIDWNTSQIVPCAGKACAHLGWKPDCTVRQGSWE